jgi:hypothetical protein
MYVLKYSALGDIIKTCFSVEVLGKLLVFIRRFPMPKYREAVYGGDIVVLWNDNLRLGCIGSAPTGKGDLFVPGGLIYTQLKLMKIHASVVTIKQR